MWTVLKFIYVEVTDENSCLRMEEKIKLYPKSGTKLHVVFEKYFFFYNCVTLLFSFTDIMNELVIMLHWVHWDSSCEKSAVSVQDQYFPLQKILQLIENAWALM